MGATRKSFLLLLISMFLMFAACEEKLDAECLNSTIEVTSLEKEYGCINTRYSLQIALSNDYKIIRNQADFDQLVTGSCIPKIDFSKYDLVIGKKQLPTGNDYIKYKLTSECESKTFILRVTIRQDATLSPTAVTYHVLIPKIKHQQQLTVDVEVKTVEGK